MYLDVDTDLFLQKYLDTNLDTAKVKRSRYFRIQILFLHNSGQYIKLVLLYIQINTEILLLLWILYTYMLLSQT